MHPLTNLICLIAAMVLTLFPTLAFLKNHTDLPESSYIKPKNVISVYDADTFRVDLPTWSPDLVSKNMPIRAKGFDAPEIRGKCEEEKRNAIKAKEITENALKNAKRIELRNLERGKYFRLLADVYIDGQSLAELQIQSGLSRPYDGGTRSGWCE